MDVEAIAATYLGMLADPTAAAAVTAPDCRMFLNGRALPAGITVEQRAERFRTAFPDGTIAIEVLARTEDSITLEYRFEGTHMGTLERGGETFPPTGRTVTYSGISFLRIRDGKVIEERAYPDSESLMAQLRHD